MKGMQSYVKDFFSNDRFDHGKVDDLLAKEMMDLSVGDRNEINEEIHGVHHMGPTETPELLRRSLQQFEIELSRIPVAKKQAYIMAITSTKTTTEGKHYVDTEEFRLRFLRCEFFDAQRAAQRMVNYLDLIATVMPFSNGVEILSRPITLNDFSQAEQSIFRKGILQYFPFRDRSGRRILTAVGDLGIRFDPFSWYKILLYHLVVASEDIEAQRKGIVIVIWPDPDLFKCIKLRFPINKGGELAHSVLKYSPIRIAAFHFCAPSNVPIFQVIHGVFALTIGGKRSRLRYHTGHDLELRYAIAGYGIPVDLLPLTPTGNIKTFYHKQWLRLRQTVEDVCIHGIHGESDEKKKEYGLIRMIECPNSVDVVFRPGRPVMNHPGNVTFRSIVESKIPLHEGATQTEKSQIVKHVVDEMIQLRGGRFLMWDEISASWKSIEDPSKRRHKVAIAFRNFKTQKRAQSNRQTNSESGMVAAFHQAQYKDKTCNTRKRKLCSG